jgi:hypothetical protein
LDKFRATIERLKEVMEDIRQRKGCIGDARKWLKVMRNNSEVNRLRERLKEHRAALQSQFSVDMVCSIRDMLATMDANSRRDHEENLAQHQATRNDLRATQSDIHSIMESISGDDAFGVNARPRRCRSALDEISLSDSSSESSWESDEEDDAADDYDSYDGCPDRDYNGSGNKYHYDDDDEDDDGDDDGEDEDEEEDDDGSDPDENDQLAMVCFDRNSSTNVYNARKEACWTRGRSKPALTRWEPNGRASVNVGHAIVFEGAEDRAAGGLQHCYPLRRSHRRPAHREPWMFETKRDQLGVPESTQPSTNRRLHDLRSNRAQPRTRLTVHALNKLQKQTNTVETKAARTRYALANIPPYNPHEA